MLTVYGMRHSGNCHKVRIALEHLDIPYQWRETDILSGATRTDEFLSLSPAGKVPLIQLENGDCLAESNAILQFIANGSALWPAGRREQADVLQWMFFEQNRHEPNVAEARFILRYLPENHPRRQSVPDKHLAGHAALAVMEQRLRESPYLAGGACSIADIALFAYTHVATEGGFDMTTYTAIDAWIGRLLKIPGFSRMDG